MKLILGLTIGMAFGAILQLGGASQYRKILGTLLLKDLDVLKLIPMSIAVGTVGIYALDLVDMANLSIKPNRPDNAILCLFSPRPRIMFLQVTP